MTTGDSKLHVFDDTNKVWRKALSTTTGILKSETTLDKTGLATDTLQTAGNVSLSSIDGKITACDTSNVTISSGTVSVTGTVTESNSAAILADTTSLDTKITACDTGSVNVTTSALPTGAATSSLQTVGNASLSTIAGTVVGSELQVDIVSAPTLNVSDVTAQGSLSTLAGTVVGSELQVDIVSAPLLTVSDATAQASLSSIDGKITACDTSSVIVTTSALPTNAATSTLQTAGNASLTELEGALYADGDAIGALDKGILCMGKDNSGNAHDIRITSNGDVEVEIADFVKGQTTSALSFPVVLASDQTDLNVKVNDVKNVGSYANLANNVTINIGALSSVVDISDMSTGNLFYEDSSTASFDELEVQVSPDGTNYFKYTDIYPFVPGGSSVRTATQTNMALHGLTHLRLENKSSTDNYTNVYATIVGSP